MAWDHLSINKPHLVYIILGGFTTLFMLCSSIIKERLYIGEATVATLVGIIFGPHAANLINPLFWGNTDQITLEFSRIVLVVQCFAVGVELPKHYMEKHWRSVTFLLVPVMTTGWLITSLFIWAVFSSSLNWLDSLCVAACVTATDPVLASSVVGKGKFAKRVPKHLRDILSAESGCNDGMAFPFIYLALYIIKYRHEPHEVALNWVCITILYECIFGCVYGVAVGYIARRLIRFAHEREYIDRESFLVFYFVLALFCAGSGSLLGMDDLLVGFACGVGFSNDGWFVEKTEESHVSNVIDLLINLAFFVYFGTIIPWKEYNSGYLGLDVWKLVVIAILVVFFRRIPIMMLLKPVIPDIKTWREALFAGHFGPIGVGAIFVSILARAELEGGANGGTTPKEVLPAPTHPHSNIITLIWPITTFLVITSIVVHGSSVAVFTLGKHINTLTLTMSYSRAVDEPHWMDRLPRIQSRSKSSMSIQRSESSFDNEKSGLPPGLLPTAIPGTFLRRQREEENPSRVQSRSSSRHAPRRSKNWDSGLGPGGPVSQSAIKPQHKKPGPSPLAWRSDSDTLALNGESPPSSSEKKEEGDIDPALTKTVSPGEIYEEGNQTVYEDEEGNVLAVEDNNSEEDQLTREESEIREGKRLMQRDALQRDSPGSVEDDHIPTGEQLLERIKSAGEELKQKARQGSVQQGEERPGRRWRDGLGRMNSISLLKKRDGEKDPVEKKPEVERAHGPARAYQFGNTIIVEDEDGEVIRKYDIPAPDRKQSTAAGQNTTRQRIDKMGKMLGLGGRDDKVQAQAPTQAPTQTQTEGDAAAQESSSSPPPAPADKNRESKDDEDEDGYLRFTAGGRRMSKTEFIDQIRDMDPRRRVQAVESSNAPEIVKREARKEAREQAGLTRTATKPDVPVVEEDSEGEGGMAAVRQVNSHDSNELRLVASGGQEVPFHDISRDLRNYQMNSIEYETAAERRRRLAVQQPAPENDSDDDGTDRVPPSARAGPARNSDEGEVPTHNISQDLRSHNLRSADGETAAERRRRLAAVNTAPEDDSDDDGTERVPPSARDVASASGQSSSNNVETAAERRRRLGALAQTREDSDAEENGRRARAPQRPNIRFADQPPPAATGRAPRQSVRWGRNVGR